MLVLSRKCQESVVVGGEVGGEYGFKVTVVEVKSGKVRLGFEVDPDVSVHRWEVWERIRAGTGHPARGSSPRRPGCDEDSRTVRDGSDRAPGGSSSRKSERSNGAGGEVRSTSIAGGRAI